MSGETHRDDDLEFNDDFVLEDAVDDLETLFDDPPAAAGQEQGEPQAGEDQILFADTPAAADPSQSFTPPVRFTEQGGVHWKGFRMSPQEIGIPTEGGAEERNPLESDVEADEAFGVDSGTELELVDDESQLMAAEGEVEQEAEDTAYGFEDSEGQLPLEGEAEAVEGEEFAEAEVAQEGETEDAWAPLPAQGLESGVPGEDGEETEEAEYTGELVEAAVGESDEQYYVEAPADRVGAPVRRRSMKWLTGLAAAVLMLGAGAAVFVHPEWFGLGSPTLVERVQIARPRLELEVAPPEVVPAPVMPGNPDTEPTPGGQQDPHTVPGPDTTPQPGPVTNPANPDPGHTTPDPTLQKDPLEQGHTPLLPAGDLLIGGFDKSRSLHTEAQLPDIVKPLLPGVRAFVQLKNGNFFIGSVKAIDAQALTMRVGDKTSDKGEIHLPVTDITRVASLGTTEYNDLLRATSGFIRLTNNNRLVGSILESVADDHVILEMKSNRILVPKSAIEEIGQNSSVSVGFSHGADEDQWVRRLAEQKLKDLNRRARQPDEERAPAPRPKGDGKPQEPTPR